jgi:Ca-activated chloride channel family protein
MVWCWAPVLGAEAPLVLVLDASGSMWGQVEGEAKIVGARRVIDELAAGLDPGRSLGLVAYGHRREGDCADIETVLEPGPLDRSRLRRVVHDITPKGKTPITGALTHAFGMAPEGARVVLVTDGLETCAADPCAAVAAARDRRSDLVVHVVGLDVGSEDVSSLECIAQVGGGLYLPAANAEGLADALEAAVAAPAGDAVGGLVVGAKRNGELVDVVVEATPRGADAERMVARTYARPETNPRRVPLADGDYLVRIRPVDIPGIPARELEVEIRDGSTVEHHVDFSTGLVWVGVTRNGALSDATYQLFAAGDRRRAIATGRTYRNASSNPARIEVPVGAYDLVVHALEVGGKPVVEVGRVEVTAGGEVRRFHELETGGLAIAVVRGDQLVDATVVVRDGKASVGSGRTYRSASTNPLHFNLAPGSYTIEVAEIRGAKRTMNVDLSAGASSEVKIDLDRP